MPTSRPAAADIRCEFFDDGAILLDMRSGRYYSLNKVAAMMWAHLSEGLSPAEIKLLLAGRYSASEDQISADLNRFISQLHELGFRAS